MGLGAFLIILTFRPMTVTRAAPVPAWARRCCLVPHARWMRSL